MKKSFSIIRTYSQPIPDNLSVVSGHMDNDDRIIANRLIRKFTGTVMHPSQEKAVHEGRFPGDFERKYGWMAKVHAPFGQNPA